GRLLGRDLPMALVSWEVVDPLNSVPDSGRPASDDAVRLRISGRRIARLHPADIADIVEELGAKERKTVFDTLTEEVAADTLEEMELEDQVSVIEHMDTRRASELLDDMPPGEGAAILDGVPKDGGAQLMGLMTKDEAEDVKELLAYEEDTAGGLMTTEYVAVSENLTAQECIDELRRLEPDAESVYYVFVIDG